MKSHSYPQIALLGLLGLLGASRAEVSIDTLPTLKMTALLNLDFGGVPPSDLSIDNTPLELADAELGFGFRPRPDIGVDVVLVHDDGVAIFDQAFASWAIPAATLAFGRQTLPLGLYAGRLIHDPLIQLDLETIAPSLLVRRDHGDFAMHLAVAAEPHSIDSLASVTHPSAIAAIDYTRANFAKIRLSGKCAHHLRLLDLGAELEKGPFVFDFEGLAADGVWIGADFAALAGVTWRATQGTAVSARFDTRRPHGQSSWSRSIAAGAVQTLAEIAYVGAEWLQDQDGGGVLTLRWGLEIELLRP